MAFPFGVEVVEDSVDDTIAVSGVLKYMQSGNEIASPFLTAPI